MRYVIVVDMQNDFVTGPLGNDETRAVASNICAKLEEYRNDSTGLIFTLDSHHPDYLMTMEGSKLPVPHCIVGTEGWDIVPELNSYSTDSGYFHPYIPTLSDNYGFVFKETFGSLNLINLLFALEEQEGEIDEIVFMGVCTDICVVSNCLGVKAAFPNVPIKVIANCCAGVTPESHEAALTVMRSCHIDVV